MNILVSACLLGVPCRYDGKSKPCNEVIALGEKHQLIPFCPEIYGGLATPREPSEINGNKVISKNGNDVTDNYVNGAFEALKIAKLLKCRIGILKENSPSCGCEFIYDGSFQGRLVKGMGITARLLSDNGIKVISENNVNDI